MNSIQLSDFSDNLDTISLRDMPKPKAAKGQVVVKMLMAAVNPSDLNFIRGDYKTALSRLIWNYEAESVCFDPQRKLPYPEPPYALGGEGVGIVVECGGGLLAGRLKGKRVAVPAGPPNGAWQDYTVVDAKRAIPVPDTISDEQAAMYIVNPLSAYAMVHEVLKVRKGGWLLQSAAGSALGKIVIRLSKIYGFRTINIVRGSANSDGLRALGGDVVIETNSQDVLTEVYKATGGVGVDYAMDCVGGALASDMIRSLTLNGHMVIFGTLAGQPISLPSRDMMMPITKLSGFYAGNWLAQQSPIKLLSMIRKLGKLASAGVFESPVEAVCPLAEAVTAVAASQKSGRTGKILIKISD